MSSQVREEHSRVVLHEVQQIKAGHNILVVDKGKGVSIENSSEFVQLGCGGDASELLDDALLNLVIEGDLSLDKLGSKYG